MESIAGSVLVQTLAGSCGPTARLWDVRWRRWRGGFDGECFGSTQGSGGMVSPRALAWSSVLSLAPEGHHLFVPYGEVSGRVVHVQEAAVTGWRLGVREVGLGAECLNES